MMRTMPAFPGRVPWGTAPAVARPHDADVTNGLWNHVADFKETVVMKKSRTRWAVAVSLAATFWACGTGAGLADDLPSPEEPWLAAPGNWAADFNQAQIACYQGSMSACDAIWLSKRVLFDTFLNRYGRTCGGRVDYRAISRASLRCVEAFPGH
jgi:hypothetical protein